SACAITRNRQVNLAVFGQNRLRGMPVAAVAAAAAGRIPLLVSQVVRQLRSQRPLHQRLLQLLEQPLIAQKIVRVLNPRQQLVQQLRLDLRHLSVPPSSVGTQNRAYTKNLTPSEATAHGT